MLLFYIPTQRCKVTGLRTAFFDEIRSLATALNGKPLSAELFQLTEEELKLAPEMIYSHS